MNPYLDFKQKAAARMARFANDPQGLLEYLAPLQETYPEHQRLQPTRPRRKAPAYKPFAPTAPPKRYWKK